MSLKPAEKPRDKTTGPVPSVLLAVRVFTHNNKYSLYPHSRHGQPTVEFGQPQANMFEFMNVVKCATRHSG